MGYNKRQFVKKNDKKILHKVRKHWVIVSMAFLGMIGATGLAKENVHASNLGANHQINNSVNANKVHNTQSTLIHSTNGRAVPNQPEQTQKPTRFNSIHQFNQDQMTKRTDALRDRILMNQAQTTPRQFHIDQSASATAKQSGKSAQEASSVSSFSNLKSTATSTVHPEMKMTEMSEPEVGDDDTDTATSVVNSALNDISTKYGAVGPLTQQVYADIAQARSASNVANAQLSRYSDIDPQSVNGNSNSSDFGSTSSYAFTDSSQAASNYDNKLNIDLEDMPSAGAIQDSVGAKFASSVADSLNYQILSPSDNQKYEGSLVSLANQVDMDYAQAQELVGSMSSMATDAVNQADSVSSVFNSVSSAAESAGSAIASITTSTASEYAVVNVSTPQELFNAMYDTNVHQINIDRSISLWGLQNTDRNKETYVTLGYNADNDFQDVQSRNLNFNGLSNDGTRNTVDFGDYNFNLNQNPVANKLTKININNVNMYGASYWGPISANIGSLYVITEYHNIDYVGSQLVFDAGVANPPYVQDTIFSGKNNVLTGASYSPTGMYRHYDYTVPGNLSPYPNIIRDGIETDTDNNERIDQGPVGSQAEKYIGDDKIDPITHRAFLKNNTLIGGYRTYNTINGGSFPYNSQTPDLAVSWSSPDTWLDGGSGATESVDAGIDSVDDQQMMQVGQGNSVTFKPDSEFNGSTTDGHCIAVGGGGSINIKSNSKVNLIPRGNDSESIGTDGGSLSGGALPCGIYVNGTGTINVGNGATLNITPMTDTDRFNYTPDGTDDFKEVFKNYAPAAIAFASGGAINVANGGTLNVQYPDYSNNDGYSIPDGDIPVVSSPQPMGGVYMGGTSAIHLHPYGNLFVNGGTPSNKCGNQGNLVYFASGGTSANSYVDAQNHSNVQLSSGGNQKIMLFYAPGGTYITVNDPKQFSLDLTHNTNPNSQLASQGVSIEGDNVTGYDQPNQNPGADYDKFDHYFGQYNRLVLPGQQYQLPSYIMDQINKTIEAIQPKIEHLNGNIWPKLGPVVQNDIVSSLEGNNSSGTSAIGDQKLGYNNYPTTGYDVLNLIEQAHLIPFGESSLRNSDNDTGTTKLNESIDLPYIIAYSMINWIEGNTSAPYHDPHSPNYQKEPTGSPNLSLSVTPDQFGRQIASELDTDADNTFGTPEDTTMSYNGLQIPIHKGGFNLTKGFAFRGVPNAYVEGVKITDPEGNVVSNGNVKAGDVISGYSYPGSYIKIREANSSYDTDDGTNTTMDDNSNNTTSVVPESDTINDHDYDYDDEPAGQNNIDYVTTAKALGSVPSIGRWSYKLPKNMTKDQVNDLVVTAHTATVGNKNSAREANYYMDGRNATLGNIGIKTVKANDPTPQPANTTDKAPNKSGYHAYLSNDGKTLTVTGDFKNYGNTIPANGLDKNHNNSFKNVQTLNLGNAQNIRNANWMFNNMSNLYTINQIGNWNTNDMQTAVGTFDKDDAMNAQYVGPIVSSWGNSSLTNNNMGNGSEDPQYNDLISLPNTSQGTVTDPIIFVYHGNKVGSTSINGYEGVTYNIDASKLNNLPGHYTIANNQTVTLSGQPHYVNVETIGSPVYVGDTVLGAEAYYQNPEYFYPNTYPNANDETPTGDPNDPTFTDNDDAGSFDKNDNFSLYGTNPSYTDTHTHRITELHNPPYSRQSYKVDDTNAGQYFQAGRLKGDLDLDNLTFDNSIYVMPNPFIIGYLTAQSARMTTKQLIANINKIIRKVTHIKGRIDGTYGHPHLPSPMNSISYYDYKPKIWSDQSSADTSMADLKATMDSLGILLMATSPNPSHPYDPYENLSSIASSLIAPDSSAANYDSLVHDEYSDVSQIDDRVSGILQTLYGYRNNLANNGQEFDQYQSSAENASKDHEADIKQMNVLEMNMVSSEDNDILSNATNQGLSASADESSASNDNQSASSDSNSMSPYYDNVRGNASNYEGDDFDSVAQSYTSSATSDLSDVVRYSTEISHRDRQMNVADGVYNSDEAQLDDITNSLEDYLPLLSSLNDLHLNGKGASLSTEYANDYSAASNALTFLNSLDNSMETYENSDTNNSSTGNLDSSEATQDSDDELAASDSLSSDANTANQNRLTESQFVSDAMAGSARSNFNRAQVFNSLTETSNLDSVTDSQAMSYNSNVASAWSQIRSLHDKIAHGVGVSRELAMMAPQIETYKDVITSANKGSSPAKSSNSSPASNSADHSANHNQKNYYGVYTVTIKYENQQGQINSRDTETVLVDKPIGTTITVNPQKYQPANYHATADDQPSNVMVTANGIQPRNVTFTYVSDNNSASNTSNSNSASNSNHSSASNSANSSNRSSASSSASHRPINPIQPNSSSQPSSSSSSNGSSAQPSSSNQIPSNNSVDSNNYGGSANQSSSSSNPMTSLDNDDRVHFWDDPLSSSDNNSASASSSLTREASSSASNSSSSDTPIQHRIQSNSSHAESSASADNNGNDSDDNSNNGTDEPKDTDDSGSQTDSRTDAASSTSQSRRSQYTQGVNDARLGNAAASTDPSYQSGYQAFERGHQQLPQTGDDSKVSLIEALLLAANGLLLGCLADRRRRHDN